MTSGEETEMGIVVPLHAGTPPPEYPVELHPPRPELVKLFTVLRDMAAEGRVVAGAIVVVGPDGEATRYIASPLSAPEQIIFGMRRLEREIMAQADEHEHTVVVG
jgi:hypothetical protein